VGGIASKSLFIAADGGVEFALLLERDTEVVMGVGETPLGLEGDA